MFKKVLSICGALSKMYSPVVNDTFHFVSTMNLFKQKLEDVSWIKITTITMISSLGKDIDIQKIRKLFNSVGSIFIARKGSKHEGFKWTLKDTTFYNQITLTYVDEYSTKSIKLFPNGSIQVAGCADLLDCNRVIRQLVALLRLVDNRELSLKSFQVVMINSNFSLNHRLNLHEVAHHFGKEKLFQVSFDPDRYSAVKIKFKPAEDMKQVTVSIFGTGKVIVTGAETLKEIVFSYNIINQHINTNSKIKVEKTETIDEFGEFLGFKIEDLVKFVEKNNFAPWRFTRNNFKINF